MASAALQRFFVDALRGALEVGLATPDDVLKHVTPDVLAAHLPRPLWGKLIAACLAAPRTDARLVVETVGVAALAEHVPGAIVWAVIADIAARALGKGLVAAPPPTAEASPAAPAAGKDVAKAAAVPAAAASSKPVAAAAPVASAPAPVASTPVASTPVASTPVAAAAPGSTKPAPSTVSPAAPRAATAPPARLGTNPGSASTPSASAASTSATPVAAADAAGGHTSTSTNAAPIAGGTGTATVAPPLSAIVDIDFDDDDEDEEPAPLGAPPHSPHRAPTVPGPQAMPSRGAGNGRSGSGAGASSRRPQASAAPRSGSRTTPPSPRRAVNSEFDIDTDVHAGKDPVSGSAGLAASAIDVPVDDDQLIDWSSSEETVTSGGDGERKR